MRAVVEKIEPDLDCSGFRVVLKIGRWHLKVGDTWGDIRQSEEIAKKVAKEINDDIFAYLKKFREDGNEMIDEMNRERRGG